MSTPAEYREQAATWLAEAEKADEAATGAWRNGAYTLAAFGRRLTTTYLNLAANAEHVANLLEVRHGR